MADGSITIDTSLDNSGIKKGVKNIETSFDKLKSSIQKTIAAIGIGKLAKDFIGTGVQYNAEIEKYQTALTTLVGSAEYANKIISNIKKDAAATPFGVSGLTQANQLLISAGLSADESRKTILALGNAISATGGGNEELSRMAVNLQQIKNVGKAASIDIKQFAFAGIDIYGLLADYLGITKQQASEMTVTWDDLNGALIHASEEGGKYFGAMEEQSHTLNGQWSTLKDNFQAFAGEALTPLTNYLKESFLPALNDFITGGNELNNWADQHKNLLIILTGVISTLTVAFIANTVAKNADLIVIWLYVTATNAASLATGVFSVALGFLTSPITLVVLAIGALITIVVLLIKNWDDIKTKTIEVWNKVKEKTVEVINSIKSKISQFADSIKSFFIRIPNDMLNIGKNIVEGLWNGIKNATTWIKNKVGEFAKGILDGMKNALGIHSPSRVFRDQVGKFIALGVGEGFSDNIKDVFNDMKTAVDFQTQKLSANLSTTATMNKMMVVNMNIQGDTYMDSEKVGRMVTPIVSKTIQTGGAY